MPYPNGGVSNAAASSSLAWAQLGPEKMREALAKEHPYPPEGTIPTVRFGSTEGDE